MKVVVGMSGGVDSSVAAALLLDQGHEVEGVFMKNWSPTTFQSLTDCPWEQDQADAEAVCAHLGIPFRSVNFEAEYKERVVDYFLAEYAAGRTPNPDVLCNSEIKFAAFLDAALEMGADAIATGHYAQVVQTDDRPVLSRGADTRKDQSYFLYRLNERQLKRAIFPLGGLQKSEVREIAAAKGLPTAQKKDSQGICFIGHIDLKDFLFEELGRKPGSVYLLPEDDGVSDLESRKRASTLIGRHQGNVFYTLGERMGAVLDNRMYRMLRGSTQVPTTYLVARDTTYNHLYISEDHNDRHLYTSTVDIDGFVITGGSQSSKVSTIDIEALQRRSLSCQVRYQQRPVDLKELAMVGENVVIRTSDPLWAVAPGQSLVVYDGATVVGGGVVCATH